MSIGRIVFFVIAVGSVGLVWALFLLCSVGSFGYWRSGFPGITFISFCLIALEWVLQLRDHVSGEHDE